jgi:predicted transcriptional regulator
MAMTLRLSDEQDKALTKIAESLGISKNTAATVAIEAFINQESQRLKIREAFALVAKRDDKLLQRLGDK